MDYRQAWQFLDDLQFFKIKLGLDSMRRFLDGLGHPERDLCFVHIAGTNGKGSVAATLLSLLAGAGYRAGLYTSPHLSSVRERFRINDTHITRRDFARHATRIRDILDGRRITYFEFTTALALLWFAEQRVDLAILEVGLGGRLDATNVIEPLASIITNVSMDHEAYLGDTIEAVAGEKAGIVKTGVPVISGVSADTGGDALRALEVISSFCRKRHAPLLLYDRDFTVEKNEDGTWNYWGMERSGCCRLRRTVKGLRTNLSGGYQLQNAALALAALEILAGRGFHVPEPILRRSLNCVQWPGRLESFRLDAAGAVRMDSDSPDSRRYLLDGAHNPAGVQSLIRALEEDFSYRRLILVWGAMADKDLSATLPRIAALADRIILVKPQGERSAAAERLLRVLPAGEREKAECAGRVAEGLAIAKDLAGSDDLICIAGSLYLIGESRQLLRGGVVRGKPSQGI